MAKRAKLRVKMRGSLHGQAIAIPRNVRPESAAAILRQELQADTPVDKGNAIAGWRPFKLSNGDMRVKNDVPYIRRLMIDGTSKQARAGVYNASITRARSRILTVALLKGKEDVPKESFADILFEKVGKFLEEKNKEIVRAAFGDPAGLGGVDPLA